MKPVLISLLLAIATSAFAETTPAMLATYSENNGSVPPPYHWRIEVTIRVDGTLQLKSCQGYDETESACTQSETKVPEAALQAIRDAALQAVLPGDPIEPLPPEDTPIGGGSRSASVTLDGVTYTIPSFPTVADQARANQVVAAILATIPAGLADAVGEPPATP